MRHRTHIHRRIPFKTLYLNNVDTNTNQECEYYNVIDIIYNVESTIVKETTLTVIKQITLHTHVVNDATHIQEPSGAQCRSNLFLAM